MDAAPALKRKGAEAPEPWMLDGVAAPAAKMHRIDAGAPPLAEPGAGGPLAEPGAGVPAPPQQGFGAAEVLPVRGEPAWRGMPVVGAAAAPALKRKGEEAPDPWMLDGVAVPATKMRRLDAEVLPPVEVGAGAPAPPQQAFGVEQQVPMCGDVAPVGVPAPAANEERAIVVYQPADAARNLLLGPLRPGASLRVSPDWIHGLRSTMLQEASNHRALFEELAARDENTNLAMVLWAPAKAQAQAAAAAASSSTAAVAEMMDEADQDGDGASMEVEYGQPGQGQTAPSAGVAPQGEAFHHQQQQWPPQHCVVPQQVQLPAGSYQPSPVTWSW